MKYWSISSQILVDEAKREGYTIDIVNTKKNLFYISNGSKKVLFKSIDSGLNSSLGLKLAGDKELTGEILERASISVPTTVYVDSIDYYKTHTSFPCVVKPIDGSKGTDVNVNIMNQEELKLILERLLPLYNRVIVQKMISGDDHRILMIGDTFVSATLRRPPLVIGDGESTIRKLIETENRSVLRGEGNTKPLTKIPIDELTQQVVNRSGYTLESVPKKGENIYVRDNCNLSTGGTSQDVTSRVPTETIQQCKIVMKELNLGLAGIDIVSDDISIPLTQQGAIIEVNATPGLRMHVYPSIGESVNVGKVILEKVFTK